MKLKESLRRFPARQNKLAQYSDEELEECRCANCGHVFKGNYCPVCRQEVGDGHITWKWVGKSILDVWGMDSRSLPNTLLQLLWRPGHLIGNYIGGHRQICYKPVNMLFIVALAYVILMQIIGQDDNFNADAIADYDRTGYFEMINFCYQCYQWLVAHPGWAMMILTMIMILPTFIVFRFAPRRPHLSFPENIFIQIFMSTLMLVVAFTMRVSNGITIFLIPLYYYICYRQLFGYKFWATAWRLAVCFFVWFFLYIRPAEKTKAAPSRKLESSPTPPVWVFKRWMRFLIRHTATPHNGPYAKAASRAGSSEKSIFMNGGIKNGIGNSKNINMYAIADSIAVPVSFLILVLISPPL